MIAETSAEEGMQEMMEAMEECVPEGTGTVAEDSEVIWKRLARSRAQEASSLRRALMAELESGPVLEAVSEGGGAREEDGGGGWEEGLEDAGAAESDPGVAIAAVVSCATEALRTIRAPPRPAEEPARNDEEEEGDAEAVLRASVDRLWTWAQSVEDRVLDASMAAATQVEEDERGGDAGASPSEEQGTQTEREDKTERAGSSMVQTESMVTSLGRGLEWRELRVPDATHPAVGIASAPAEGVERSEQVLADLSASRSRWDTLDTSVELAVLARECVELPPPPQPPHPVLSLTRTRKRGPVASTVEPGRVRGSPGPATRPLSASALASHGQPLLRLDGGRPESRRVARLRLDGRRQPSFGPALARYAAVERSLLLLAPPSSLAPEDGAVGGGAGVREEVVVEEVLEEEEVVEEREDREHRVDDGEDDGEDAGKEVERGAGHKGEVAGEEDLVSGGRARQPLRVEEAPDEFRALAELALFASAPHPEQSGVQRHHPERSTPSIASPVRLGPQDSAPLSTGKSPLLARLDAVLQEAEELQEEFATTRHLADMILAAETASQEHARHTYAARRAVAAATLFAGADPESTAQLLASQGSDPSTPSHHKRAHSPRQTVVSFTQLNA